MKRSIALVIALLMLLASLGACTPASETPDTPDVPQAPTEPDTPVEPDAPEVPTELVLFEDGASDYTLVYDDSDSYLTVQVEAFLDRLSSDRGVTLTAVGASDAEADYGHEIVVGNVRPCAKEMAARLNETNDFAYGIVGDDYVLCATGSRLYAYLFAVLENRVMTKLKDGGLTVDRDKDLVYHESAYKNRTYIEYKFGAQAMTQDTLAQLFEARIFTAKDGTRLAYRLYVPYDYDESREYPVLLLLHGAGERGNDNLGNLLHVVSNLFNISKTPVTDAIIVAPQCPAGNQWVDTPWANGSYDATRVKISNELKAVMEIMDSVEREFSTDYDRYYVMGLSMGGFGTWDLLMRYPDYFAAGVPMCGGADPSKAESLVDVPIRTFHGSADPTVPVSGTREMAAALEAAGSTVFTYEEMEGAGHGIWGTVASRKDVIEWLFAQDLSKR